MSRILLKSSLITFLLGILFTSCNSQQKTTPQKSVADSVYTFKPASRDGIGKFYKGREISQVMGAGGSAWLERSERQQEENAQLAIDKILLAPNGIVADIGAGTGYFSFRLAAKVPRGKVYAVEIQDEMVQALNARKSALADSVVEVVKGTTGSTNLPPNSIDLALMVDVYHELEFPHEMLQDIFRSLKKNGKLLLVEYRGEDPSVPIKELHKTTVAQLNRELMANGFELDYRGDFLPIQHFLLYRKK